MILTDPKSIALNYKYLIYIYIYDGHAAVLIDNIQVFHKPIVMQTAFKEIVSTSMC